MRMIDNFASNTANSYAFSWETVTNDGVDVVSSSILTLQRALVDAGHSSSVLVGLEDFVGAFKTLPPDESQRWLLWVLVWCPSEQRWYTGELQTLPFGSLGSVLAWWRVAHAQRCILRRLFNLPCMYYVDDTHLIAPAVVARRTKNIVLEGIPSSLIC